MAEEAVKTPSTSDGRRRRMASRRGMSFGGGGLSQSSAGQSVADHDDVADGDVDINAAVQAQATRPPAVLPRPQPNPEDVTAGQEEFNPRARLEQVRGRSSEYEREYRLGLLHRMLIRKLPQDEIAAQLGLSVRQVQRDIQDLKARLRESAKALDIEVIIGNSTGFYEEVQAMAMRAASNAQVPVPMRLAGMRTALAAHNDMHRFYQAAGVYDVLRFKKGAGDGAMSDIQRLMDLTNTMLTEACRDGANPLGEFSGDDREGMEL